MPAKRKSSKPKPKKLGAGSFVQVVGSDIRHRTIVDRRILATHEPSGGLDSRSADLLRKWVAKRYARPVFPDAFNERVRPAGKWMS